MPSKSAKSAVQDSSNLPANRDVSKGRTKFQRGSNKARLIEGTGGYIGSVLRGAGGVM